MLKALVSFRVVTATRATLDQAHQTTETDILEERAAVSLCSAPSSMEDTAYPDGGMKRHMEVNTSLPHGPNLRAEKSMSAVCRQMDCRAEE